MKVKDFKQLLDEFNPDAEMSTGNSTGYSSRSAIADNTRGNIDCDVFQTMDRKKDLKKVKTVTLWCSE